MKHMTIEEVIEYLNSCDEYENNFAVRGDDFIPVKSFRKSCYHGDDCKSFQLDGVSAIDIPYYGEQYIRKAVMLAKKYGKNVFLLTGKKTNCHEWACDPHEVLIKNNKIIAIIDL